MPNDTHGLLALLQSGWTYVMTVVGLIVWLVRGEAQTKANSSEIRRLWKQRDEDQRAHKDARDTTNDLLTELRQDIKTLLARRD